MVDAASLFLDNCPDIPLPPTEDELPYDDGEPMETQRHKLQMDVLVYPLFNWLSGQDAFVSGNMFVYFSPEQVKTHDYKGTDVFVVLDVSRRERKSWVVWQEGKGPDVIIELLSPSTARFDKREKKLIYQDSLRVPEYFWYDPFNKEDFAGFSLQNGVYEPINPDSQGRLMSRQLNLILVPWIGNYQEYEAVWLRWATPKGELLPTQDEIAQKERQRVEKLAQKLRELGINPDEV